MGRTLFYPKNAHNTINRYKDRASYDLTTIHTIINSAQVLHVSFPPSTHAVHDSYHESGAQDRGGQDPAPGGDETKDPFGPFPALLPMIGKMGSFAYPSADVDEPLDCYLHGYLSSRLMRLAREASSSSSSSNSTSNPNQVGEGRGGLPVTIAATHVDGLVLSLTPNTHTYNYRSAILHGFASPVTDPAETLYALQLITDGVVPGRWTATRVPPDSAELASVTVLRVRVVGGSGKVRDAGVQGDGKADVGDQVLRRRVWTGVVPVQTVVGEPVADKENMFEGEGGEKVPEYLREFVEEFNGKGA